MLRSTWLLYPNCSVLKGDGSAVSAVAEGEGNKTLRMLLGGGPAVQVDIPAHMRHGWAPFNGPGGQASQRLCIADGDGGSMQCPILSWTMQCNSTLIF
jgi:hypothetical protein